MIRLCVCVFFFSFMRNFLFPWCSPNYPFVNTHFFFILSMLFYWLHYFIYL